MATEIHPILLTQTGVAPTIGQVLTATSTTAAAWQTLPTVTTATNLAGGLAGEMPYQSAANTTLFTAAGTSNQILQSNGSSAPTWTSAPTIAGTNFTGTGASFTAGTATNVAGGAAGEVNYQTGSGTTAHTAAGTTNQLLQSNGTSAPTWTSAPTVAGTNLTGTASALSIGGNAATATNATEVGGITVTGTPSAGNILTATSSTAADWAVPSFVNPMTTLGDIMFENSAPTPARLAGNPTSTREFLLSVGNGSIAEAPSWASLVSGDIPNNAANTTGNAATATTAVTCTGTAALATGIVGGTGGEVVYQSGVGNTSFSSVGTTGQVLTSAGTSTPTWTSQSALVVGSTGNLSGGAAGELPYQSAAGTTLFTAAGTSGQVLVSGGTGTPTWSSAPTISAANMTSFPTLNQNTTGNAATVTTNANLTGPITSVGNATTIAGPLPAISGAALVSLTAANISAGTAGISITGNSATVTTNANLTGNVTSVGNATTIASIPAVSGAALTSLTPANISAGTAGISITGNAATVTTNANLTGGVTSSGNVATVVTNANLTGGVTSVGNATTVVTNANLTGNVTSVGNATTIAVLPAISGAALTSLTGANVTGTVASATSATSATTATNLAGGTADEIPYQSAAGTTTFISAPGANVVLTGNSGAPAWSAAPVFSAANLTSFPTLNQNTTGTAAGIAGGAAGEIVFQTGSGATSFTAAGTSNQLLASAGTGTPAWTSAPTVSAANMTSFPTLNQNTTGSAATATTATNIAGGTDGEIPYQTAAGTTSFIAVGTSNYILQGNGAASPTWTNAPTVAVTNMTGTGGFSITGNATTATTATDIAAGAAGEVLYQSGAGVTGFTAAGTSGQYLTSGGTGTPTWTTGLSNPMTTLGDIIYENSTPAPARLAGNTTTTKEFLSSTGNGTISAAPVWGALVSGDIPNNAANTTGTATNATNATNSAITATTSNTTYYPIFVTATSGNLPDYAATNLTYNPSTATLTATNFAGTSTATDGLISATTTVVVSAATAPVNGQLLTATSSTAASWQAPIMLQNSESAAYTTVLADEGKHILHPTADTTARTFTIAANSSVAYPIGTAITFVNQHGAGVVTIAITSDAMYLAGAGTTGNRTLAANGVATALKVTSTEWIISGVGLT